MGIIKTPAYALYRCATLLLHLYISRAVQNQWNIEDKQYANVYFKQWLTAGN